MRTIVNETPNYIPKGKDGATSKDIGQILVNRKLSKTSILESANKLKRARDHANNASFLGLLTPIHVKHEHEFFYNRSVYGELLSKYKFEDSCPKDLHESAIFTDRMMRLKLTNPYDSLHTYSKFHCRPFLNILTALGNQNPLHLSQIHYISSLKQDICDKPEEIKNLVQILSKYPKYQDDSVDRFMKDFKINTRNKKREVSRSTKPLLDWLQQVGLVSTQENDWYFISEKGVKVQKFYSTFFPIWFDQLDFDPSFHSALLLIYLNAYVTGDSLNIDKFTNEAKKALNQLQTKFGLWDRSFKKLTHPIDFDLNYDVPVDARQSVLGYIQKINKNKIDTSGISLSPINQIENILAQTGMEKAQWELGKALGIDIPRRECFQTDLEWQTCIRLRLWRLNASPYQGELEGETDLPMATDNPDVMIRNGIRTLVECKSYKEWGKIVVYGKKIAGELNSYQEYAEEVAATSVVFVCEVDKFDEKRFKILFKKKGNKLNKIVMTTWGFLDRANNNRDLVEKLVHIIKEPESCDPEQRILE